MVTMFRGLAIIASGLDCLRRADVVLPLLRLTEGSRVFLLSGHVDASSSLLKRSLWLTPLPLSGSLMLGKIR